MVLGTDPLDVGHVVQFYGHEEEPADRVAGGYPASSVSGDGHLLRIAVRDASPLPPGPAGPGLPAAPLHGLGAVDALASRWGVDPLGHSGKSVWVELRR